jgi:hypothetical protein
MAEVTLALDGVPESDVRLTAKDLAGTAPAGLVIRLENRLTGLEALRTRTLNEIDRLGTETARAREDTCKPFPQTDQLAAARDRAREINRQLEEAARPQQPEDHHEASGVVVHDAGDPAFGRATTRWPTQVVEARGADRSITGGTVSGVPSRDAEAAMTIPAGQVSNGEVGYRSGATAEITQRDFPERNPLAGLREPEPISPVQRDCVHECRRGSSPSTPGIGLTHSP